MYQVSLCFRTFVFLFFFLCILLECSPPDICFAYFLTPSDLWSNATFLGEILDSPLENYKPFHAFLHWDFQFSFLFSFHRICHYWTHSVYMFIVHFFPLECKLSEADFFVFCPFLWTFYLLSLAHSLPHTRQQICC